MIAAILEDPAPHAGKIYPLYGAVELDHYEIAEAMSRDLGRHVGYVPIDLDEFAAILEKRGASPTSSSISSPSPSTTATASSPA